MDLWIFRGQWHEGRDGKADTGGEYQGQEEFGAEAEVLVFSERTPYFVGKP